MSNEQDFQENLDQGRLRSRSSLFDLISKGCDEAGEDEERFTSDLQPYRRDPGMPFSLIKDTPKPKRPGASALDD